jgi:hypothetical protein
MTASERVSIAFQLPRQINRVGAGFHPYSMLDDRVAAAKTPSRDRAVEVKFDEAAVTVWCDRPAAPAIGEQRVCLALNGQRGIGLGQNQNAA